MKNQALSKKTDLRKLFKEKRALLTSEEKNKFSLDIAQNYFSSFDTAGKKIHVFIPIIKLNEPDLFIIIKQLWEKNARVFTSVVRPGNLKLSHIEIFPDTVFTDNDWGIPTPEGEPVTGIDFDQVLVPLLCCDKKGNRVGYGKGYYDHFLKQQEKAAKTGISFFPPIDEKIRDIEKFDIPLDQLITPTEIFTFKKTGK